MFPDRLNAIRKEKGYTALQMSELLSISIRTYRFYEAGKTQPSLEALVKIADLFDVSVDYLLGRDEFLVAHAGEHREDLPAHPTDQHSQP